MSASYEDRIARALGSSRTIDLEHLPIGGPLDLLRLRSIVAELRRAAPTVSCELSLSQASWQELGPWPPS